MFLLRESAQAGAKNPFLEMGFIRFGLIAALFVAFLPWSVAVSLALMGWQNTKFLAVALVRDWLTTMLMLLVAIVVFIGGAVYWLLQLDWAAFLPF